MHRILSGGYTALCRHSARIATNVQNPATATPLRVNKFPAFLLKSSNQNDSILEQQAALIVDSVAEKVYS